jgi:hypothetical protein
MVGATALSLSAAELEKRLRGQSDVGVAAAQEMQDLFSAFRAELVRGNYISAA